MMTCPFFSFCNALSTHCRDIGGCSILICPAIVSTRTQKSPKRPLNVMVNYNVGVCCVDLELYRLHEFPNCSVHIADAVAAAADWALQWDLRVWGEFWLPGTEWHFSGYKCYNSPKNSTVSQMCEQWAVDTSRGTEERCSAEVVDKQVAKVTFFSAAQLSSVKLINLPRHSE